MGDRGSVRSKGGWDGKSRKSGKGKGWQQRYSAHSHFTRGSVVKENGFAEFCWRCGTHFNEGCRFCAVCGLGRQGVRDGSSSSSSSSSASSEEHMQHIPSRSSKGKGKGKGKKGKVEGKATTAEREQEEKEKQDQEKKEK